MRPVAKARVSSDILTRFVPSRRTPDVATLLSRFWAKIDTDMVGTGCWEWRGAFRCAYGYGEFRVHGVGIVLAHRLAFELVHGPIPEDLELDHLCRNHF